MRRILISGLFACFLIGVVVFFLRIIFVDALLPIFRPIIHFLTDEIYWEIPLTIILTLIVITIVGFLITRIRLQDIFNRFMQRRAKNFENAKGALVVIAPDTYYLAIVIKEVGLKRANNEIEKYYVLYSPLAPLPWSGLPIMLVAKEKVLLLKLSYGALYSMVGSFGSSTPDLLTEIQS
jgi:uncharacterized membrane protein